MRRKMFDFGSVFVQGAALQEAQEKERRRKRRKALESFARTKRLSDEDATAAFVALRWPMGIKCPKCSSPRVRRVPAPHEFWCGSGRHHFTLRTHTSMQGTRLPLRIWWLTMCLFRHVKGAPNLRAEVVDVVVAAERPRFHLDALPAAEARKLRDRDSEVQEQALKVWSKLAAAGGDPLKRPLRRRPRQVAAPPPAGPATSGSDLATSRPPATTPAAEPERLMTVSAVLAERGVPAEDIDYFETEKAHQSVLHVTTAPTLLQTLLRRLRQSQCIVQFATGQQPSVRGDGSAAKLQPYTAVETERGTGVGAFTHWVPPEWVRYQDLKQSITTSLALMITATLCYSATSGSSVADYGKPCRVDMGNVG